MKQTNNAIKFLMAQYRSIFKHAYLKGILGASVLTLGLVASQANAAGKTIADLANSDDLTLTQTDMLSATANSVSHEWKANVTLTSDSTHAITGSGAAATLSGDGSLTISGSATTDAITIKAGASGTFTVDISSINVQKGTLNVNADDSAAETVVSAKNIVIGQNSPASYFASAPTAIVNVDKSGSFGTNTSLMSLNQGGQIDLKADSTGVFADTFTLNGGTLLNSATAGKVDVNKFDMIDGTINVTGTKLTINQNDSNATEFTAKGGTIQLANELELNKALNLSGAKVSATSNNAKITTSNAIMTDGQIDVATGGTLTIHLNHSESDKKIFDIQGGALNLSGTLSLSAETTKLGDKVKLTGSATGKINLADSSTLELTNGQTLVDFIKKSHLQLGASTVDFGASNIDLDTISFTADSASTGIGITNNKEASLISQSFSIGSKIEGASGSVSLKGQDVTVKALTGAASDYGVKTITATNKLSISGSVKSKHDYKLGSLDDAKEIVAKPDYALKTDSEKINAHLAQEKFISDALNTGSSLTLESGSLAVNTGKWTSNINLTLGSSSESNAANLTVGSGDTNTDTAAYLSFEPGKTLSLVNSTITVGNNSPKKLLSATLDLSNTNVDFSTIATGKNASFTVEQKGTLIINETTASNLLTDTQAKTTIKSGGVLEVKGNLKADTSKLISGSETASSIVFSDSSTTETYASLKAESFTLSGDSLAIGANNKLIGGQFDITASADAFSLSEGILDVSKGLSSNKQIAVLADGQINFDGTGTVNANLIASGGTINFNTGDWSAKDLIASGSAINIGGQQNDAQQYISANVSANKLDAQAGNVTVHQNSVLSLKEIAVASTGSSLATNGQVFVDGKDTSSLEQKPEAGAQGYMGVGLLGTTVAVTGKDASFTYGSTALKNMTSGSGVDIIAYDNFGSFNLTQGGKLVLDFGKAGYSNISLAEITKLKKELITSAKDDGLIDDGLLDLGSTKVTGISGTIDQGGIFEKDGTISWDNYQQVQDTIGDTVFADIQKAEITKVNGLFQGNVGSITLESSLDSARLDIKGNTSLNSPSASNNFIQNANKATAGANLQKSVDLALNGNGKIGDISLAAGSVDNTTRVIFNGKISAQNISGETNSEVNVNKAADVSFQTVNSDIFTNEGSSNFAKLSTINTFSNLGGVANFSAGLVSNKLNNKGSVLAIEEGTKLDLQQLNSYQGSSIKAFAIDVDQGATIAGQVESKTINLADNAGFTVVGGDVKVSEFNANANSTIFVGYEGDEQLSAPSDDDLYDPRKDATGTLEIAYLNQNGSYIQVDPNYDQKTALLAIKYLGSKTQAGKVENDVGVISGNVLVGRNSALGIGVNSLDELNNEISLYQTNGKLSIAEKDSIGAIMYLNGTVTVSQDKGLTLTSSSIKDLEALVQDNTFLKPLFGDQGSIANSIYLGNKTAIIINGEALNQADLDNKALISFAGSSVDSSTSNKDNKIIADGGKIILTGNVQAKSYKIFATPSDSSLVISNADNVTTSDKAKIEVSTQNNFLTGLIYNDLSGNTASSGQVNLSINEKHAEKIMDKASQPVFDTIVAYAQGYNGDEKTLEGMIGDKVQEEVAPTPAKNTRLGEDTSTSPENKPQTIGKYEYHNYFLQETVSQGDGFAAEQVARLGVYAGVVQSAMLSSSTTTTAISSRMGMGATQGNLSFADNGQGTGLWVTPVYKNSESDSFKAQGVNYGVDMDLYGVALGADYTLANGLRVGLMFNVGSGDADGKQAAQGVKNDFDYYGFATYLGYSMNKFSFVADLSYTVADNDIKANNDIDEVRASIDSSALSLGVTGQYALALGGLDVVPHAGLRFTSLDMDNYAVRSSKGDVAHYDAERLNVFSIPVGVSFSKDIVAGSWTVKPSFDLTITGNFGDDEADGTVDWGVTNLETKTSTEIFDNFVYGASLGVAAKSGNFALGLGVNYAGSSNTDEYGVNANARFVF